MQEETAPPPLPTTNVERKHHPLRLTLLVLLVILLMAASAGAAYWWRGRKATTFERTQATTIGGLQTDKTNLQKQLTALQSAQAKAATPSTSTATCTPTAPNAATIENIQASITSGNTAALEGYMAASVQDVYAAADGIPAKTPADSVSDITSFTTGQLAGTWIFPVSAASLATYRAGSYGKYFPSIAVAGSSTRHRVISFSFDCTGKINTVFMAADDSVL